MAAGLARPFLENLMKMRGLGLFGLLLSCALCAGQKQQTVAASPIDTRSFFPQVANVIVTRPITVFHESPILRSVGPPNSLVAGGTFDEERVMPGAFFPGMGQAGLTPGDPDIAVGPNNIVEVINSQIGFFSKTGTLQLQQSSATMFAGMGATSFQFDPKVFYDRIHGRFVILYLEKTSPDISKLLVAVSDDSNPNGTWFRYRLESMLVIGGINYWLDYPGFGYNKDAYVVSGNMFRFSGSGFAGAQFIVMPSAPMLTGGPVTVTSIPDSSSGSAQMCEVIDPTNPFVFGISRHNNTNVRIFAIQNPGTTPTLSSINVAVPSNNGPAGDAESTNGRFLDTIDSRVYNAVWRGGRIVAAHNYEGTSFVSTRWYEVNTGNWPTSGSPSLVQSGSLNSATLNQFCPAINKNATGKISTTFTSSSTTVTANMTIAGRLPGDALGTMGAPTILETSPGNNYSQGRWGDYWGVDVDPNDDVTFWGVHMIVAANNAWTTVIRNWTIPGVVDSGPNAFTWLRGTPISGDLASLGSDDGNYLVGRAGAVSLAGAPAELQVESTAPSTVLYGIDLTAVSKVNSPGIQQKIELWNFATSAWVMLGQSGVGSVDGTQTVSAPGNPLDYVEAGTKRVRARLSWVQSGPVFVYPWTVSIDQVKFSINSA